MGDSFQGSGSVVLRPGDMNVPIYLRLKACSASTKNDGSMPYGSTVISATVTATRAQTNTATTSLVSSSTESGNSIIAYLSYSTNLIKGLYHIKASVTMSLAGASTTARRDYKLNRVYVKT